MAEMKPQVYKDPRPAEYFDAVPRRRPQGGRLDLHLRPHRPHPADAAALPGAGDRRRERPQARRRWSSPPTTSARWTTSSSASTCGGRSASWPNRSSSARRSSPTSTSTAASSRSAAATTTRRRSRPPACSSSRARCCSSTPRAAARARGELGEPKPGIGRIALESGAPIVPVAIHGSERRAQLEAAALPQGHRPVRRAAHLPGRGGAEPRAPARGRDRDLRRVREMYEGLR